MHCRHVKMAPTYILLATASVRGIVWLPATDEERGKKVLAKVSILLLVFHYFWFMLYAMARAPRTTQTHRLTILLARLLKIFRLDQPLCQPSHVFLDETIQYRAANLMSMMHNNDKQKDGRQTFRNSSLTSYVCDALPFNVSGVFVCTLHQGHQRTRR